jgi:hypothetical protein
MYEKVHCSYWLAEFKFPVTVWHKFHQKYGCDPPNNGQQLMGVSSDMEETIDHGRHLNKSKPFKKLSNEVCGNTFSEEENDLL